MAKKILIVDAYNPAHVGNGVLLHSSVEVLNRAFPDNELHIATLDINAEKSIKGCEYSKFLFNFPAYQSRFQKIKWVLSNFAFIVFHYINMKTIKIKPSFLTMNGDRKTALQQIENADIVISITGEGIRDTMRNVLPFILFTYWLAARLGKKMIIFPQSLGPLELPWTKRLVRMVLPKLSLVTARDSYALSELKKIEMPADKFYSCPDVGVIQPFYSNEKARTSLSALGVESNRKLIIGLTVSECLEWGMEKTDYIDTMVLALKKRFSESEVQFILMPANMPVNEYDQGDFDICEKVYDQLKKDFDVFILEKRVYLPEEFKGIQALLDLFISTRMHASIMATMAITPTITINTQRKLLGYMKNIGMKKYSLDIADLTKDILVNAIDDLLKNQDKVRNNLREKRDRFNNDINRFAQMVGQLCD